MAVPPPKRQTWGEFLFVWGLLAFLVLGPALLRGAQWVGFFTGFWFAWATLAAFVGLTFAVLWLSSASHGLWHVTAVVIILGSIGACLVDQHFFATPGFRNWMVSALAIAALTMCVRPARALPFPLRRLALPVTQAAKICAILWTTLGGCHIFIPVLFMPENDLAGARLYFVAIFGGVVVVSAITSLLLSRWQYGAEETGFLAQEVSSAARWRLYGGGVVALLVACTLLHFIAGTSSGSGQLLSADGLSGAMMTAGETEAYLLGLGCRRAAEVSGEPASPRSIERVALLEYPVASRRAVALAIHADGSVNYAYEGLSSYEAGEVRRFCEHVRAHSRDIWRTEKSKEMKTSGN